MKSLLKTLLDSLSDCLKRLPWRQQGNEKLSDRFMREVAKITPSRKKLCAEGPDSFALADTQPSQGVQGNSTPQTVVPKKDPFIDTVFADRYKILAFLGKGGMGTVYKVENLIARRLCEEAKSANQPTKLINELEERCFRALKIMNPDCAADPSTVYRFETETAAIFKIRNENVIQIIDTGKTDDGRPWFTMPYLDGQSLSQLLKERKKLPIAESLAIFIQICKGLDAAHSAGTIHRDIKPANLMILCGENLHEHKVIVVDFGIAKVVQQAGDPTMRQTTTGNIFGTPLYMSPEQCYGRTVDHRADIYSMGCLMYEVLSGVPPLVGDSYLATMQKQCTELPRSLSMENEDIRLVQSLDQIIAKTLQKDPAQRFQTMKELCNEIESASALASKKVPLLSIIKLKLEGVYRASYRLGPSRKLILSMGALVIGMAILCVLSSTLLAPYVVARDPKFAERTIAWQELPPLKSIDDKALREQIDQFKMDIDIYMQEHGTELNPALFEKKNRLAEFYYDNGKYDDAIRAYKRLCDQGNRIFDEEFASTGSAPMIGHSLALANLNYSRCLLRYGVFGESSRTAKKGITCIGNSAGVDNGPGAYLNGVVALTALRLKADREWADKPFSDFMGFINKQRQKASYAIGEENTGLTAEQSEEVAPLLSELGDAYSELGDVSTATKAYEAAKDAWRTLGKRGAYNLAVVNQRLGRLSVKSGNFDRAIGLLKNSVNAFEALGGKNDLNKSKVLFDEADALWKEHKDPLSFNSYIDAFSTHAEAVSIWASQHSTKPR